MALAALARRPPRLFIHPAEHQDPSVCRVLDDRRGEAVEPPQRLGPLSGDRGHAAASSARRTGNPASAIACFTSEIEWIRRWKIEAARTASAPPSRTALTKSAGPAAPPEAMTGTRTRSVMLRSSAVSYPKRVPSRSIDVRR